MDLHARRVLEFDKVLDIVGRNAHWGPGREAVLALEPAASPASLRERQQEVREGLLMLEQGGSYGAGGLADVRPQVRAAARGQTLRPLDLLAVRELCLACRQTGRLMRERAASLPALARWCSPLEPFPRLEQEVGKSLAVDGRVLDAASPRLHHARQEVTRLQALVQELLQRVLRQAELSRMLRDPLVTTRGGRHVLPVKAEYRGVFPGLVLDQSSSGATLFMEPWSVVETGNLLRRAILAEEKEVEAVLNRLSGIVAVDADRLLQACDILGYMDGVMAVATFARDFHASLPRVAEGDALLLKDARHPLLMVQPDLEVVPITIGLGRDIRTVVITGPNTGGKTVALKSLGLLTLMALSGMPIPAAASSTVPFLRGVFADIGDEQGIAQNLSTFSSHLTQMLHILPQAGRDTLVLLDEMGAGTDPAEGEALGKALLEHLHETGALTVVTTHLSELKHFAEETPGMSNAAVEFDLETLQPTFRVLMGVAGRSNALHIAARLGLPPDILRRARGHVGRRHAGVEHLLEDLDQERTAAAHLSGRLRDEELKLEAARRDYGDKMASLETERGHVLAAAAEQAERILSRTSEEAHAALRDLRRSLAELDGVRRAEVEEARRLARELADVLARAADSPEALEGMTAAAAAMVADALRDLARRLWEEEEAEPEPDLEEDAVDAEARVAARTAEARLQELSRVMAALRAERAPGPTPAASPGRLSVGLKVYVRTFGQDGLIESIDNGQVEVRVGALRLRVKEDEVDPH